MCITPMSVKDGFGEKVNVPCGKCPACRSRRASAWSFRLMQEDKISISSQFITLTYDTKHVPITRNGFLSLSKRDLQLFFKRLRKASGQIAEKAIKYYAVGEYGGQTKRPHYHIILFNGSIEAVAKAWQLGSIHFGDLNAATVGYTLKYISKPGWRPMHRNDDRQAQFSLMSKRLGANYITDKTLVWHKADLENRMYLNLTDGKKCSMPRYYKDRIYTDSERQKAGEATAQRLLIQKAKADKLLLMSGKTYSEIIRSEKESVKSQFKKQNSKPLKLDTL